MRATTTTLTLLLLATMTLGACATRGHVRTALAEQRAEVDAAIAGERTERIAADERLAADLATLRNDLQAMRTEFNASIEAVAEGLQFALPVHFAFDDASLRETDRPALERFVRIVNRHYPGAVVTVEGFADPAGTASYNRALSQRRADAVRDWLLQQSVQAHVRTVGYGETRQVVEGAQKDDPGAELNRRVVFVIETPAAANVVSLVERSDR
jgi:outer membrane protein OmpA-like peptidoglycan-associated protein